MSDVSPFMSNASPFGCSEWRKTAAIWKTSRHNPYLQDLSSNKDDLEARATGSVTYGWIHAGRRAPDPPVAEEENPRHTEGLDFCKECDLDPDSPENNWPTAYEAVAYKPGIGRTEYDRCIFTTEAMAKSWVEDRAKEYAIRIRSIAALWCCDVGEYCSF